MQNWICATCGVQFDAGDAPPSNCPICDDERQYVGQNGQQWTSVEQLRRTHHNRIETVEPNLIGIGTEPGFAIGQRALLVQTPQGNVLWDCTPFFDPTLLVLVRALGGIHWIAVSHPHLVSNLVDWSRAFDNAPIYWHADNAEWIMRQDGNYVLWQDETCELAAGLTLIRCGGHFAGSTVLHWANGADKRGVLLAGDTVQVVSDRRYVSFMYSYPNIIPLNARTVQHIVDSIEPYAFDRIYGGWWHSIVASDAKNAVERSAERYIKFIQ